MNSKQRIEKALEHNEISELAVDFGSTSVTGIHVSTVYRLRQYYGLDKPKTPVKVIEPFQMLGEIKDDLREIMCGDVKGIPDKGTIFGFENKNWKEWQLWDGIPVLVPELFNTKSNDDGSIYQYPQGDKSIAPSGKMPKKGLYFDSITRQKKTKEEELNPDDNIDFRVIEKNELSFIKKQTEKLFDNQTALIFSFGASDFGEIAFIPGLSVKDPKGIRDTTEWLISLNTRREHIRKIFERQCNIAIRSLEKIYDVIGNKIDIVFISGNDFGTQNSLIFSLDTYRDLFKPFHKKVAEWIHDNTGWKTMLHSCGAVYEMIPDFIEVGIDILNPVQISCKNMDPVKLKKEYGKDIVFWGGGVDTQRTLAFGTPKEVSEEVKRNIYIFKKNGGFVFNTVHNIQANVTIENIDAMINVLKEYR